MNVAPSREGPNDSRSLASRDILTMSNVSMVYDAQAAAPVVALENFNLSIAENQFVSLIGPSGCGKSTALSIMAGLLEPTAGDIRINGHDPSKARKAREIGMVFQQPVLLPWRTIEENCGLLLEVAGQWDKAGKARVRETLDLVGLSDFAASYPHQLSGGMRQRASIARALCLDPVMLMMDEPFGALDEFTRHGMNVELLNIWGRSRKTIVFITHSVAEAVFLSDRVIAMSPRPGRIVADVSIELPRPRSGEVRYTAEFNAYVVHLQRLLEPKAARPELLT
jgi:NitT/TauT family transport system ATP-binding protein